MTEETNNFPELLPGEHAAEAQAPAPEAVNIGFDGFLRLALKHFAPSIITEVRKQILGARKPTNFAVKTYGENVECKLMFEIRAELYDRHLHAHLPKLLGGDIPRVGYLQLGDNLNQSLEQLIGQLIALVNLQNSKPENEQAAFIATRRIFSIWNLKHVVFLMAGIFPAPAQPPGDSLIYLFETDRYRPAQPATAQQQTAQPEPPPTKRMCVEPGCWREAQFAPEGLPARLCDWHAIGRTTYKKVV